MINFAVIIVLFINTTPYIQLPVIDNLERIFSDIRLKITMPKGIDDRVVIADIDEDSITELGHWPWSRDRLAELVDTLFNHYQIKVLGFDMVFSEADEVSGLRVLEQLDASEINDVNYHRASAMLKKQMAFDDIFSESIKGRNIVLGMVFDQGNDTALNKLNTPIKTINSELAKVLTIAKPLGYTTNIDVIQQATDSMGFFDNPNIEVDGLYRRVPLIQLYENGFYPSLALAVTRKAIGDLDYYVKVEQVGSYAAIDQVQLGSLVIPVDESGSVTIPYRGPEGSFPYISVKDIINKTADPAALKDRIILLGTSAPGLHDLRASPVDTQLPGVEVHANIITGILDNRIPYKPSYILAVELLIIVTIGLLMMAVSSYLSPLMMMLFTTVVATSYLIINFMLWQQGIILFLATPLVLIAFTFTIHMSWGFFAENKIKRSVTKLFGQYVPPEIVDEMVEQPELATQEGQSRELTVLFADIRGFTTISEELTPQELCELLNKFFTPMTKVIHDCRGTIDKYMGDCIMSFWGSPVPDDKHADQAIRSALSMLEKLEQLQPEFQARGWPAIKIGIGLNTGMMNVGNMGSEYRMVYTIVGDAVNLGARLEGLTKQYGVSLIVSEFTKAAAPHYVFRQLDQVKVKGKEQAVTIYEVLGAAENVSENIKKEVEQFHHALELYYAQKWDDAKTDIELLAEKNKHLPIAILYQVYLQRITRYQLERPTEDWDGVFTHKNK